MQFQNLMTLSDELGKILSPIIKFIVIGCLFIFVIIVFQRNRVRKTPVTRNMLIMMVFYMIAPLFSSFDVILDWQNVLGENTFLGMGLAFLMSALGNIAYYWFIVDLYYNGRWDKDNPKIRFLLISIGELLSTVIALILRMLQNPLAFIFIVIHMVLSLIIYVIILRNSILTGKRVELEYKKRFVFLEISAIWMILMIIFFAIDSFYVEFTIWSFLGWFCLLGCLLYIYKGYLARSKDQKEEIPKK